MAAEAAFEQTESVRGTPGERVWSSALGAIGGLAAAVVLVANAPAAWVMGGIDLPASTLGYRGVEGTVWAWTLREAVVNGVDIGDVQGQLNRRRIISGEVAYGLTASGGALAGAGEVYRRVGGATGLRGGAADIDLALFRRYRLMGQPLAGAARIRDISIVLANGECRSAGGDIWTDALSDTSKSLGKSALELNGGLSCDAEKIALSLEGESPDIGSVRLQISITPAEGYDLEIIAHTDEKDVRDALEFSGFKANEDRLELKQSFVF